MTEPPIDSFNHYPEGKGNQSITLFLISFTYSFIIFLILLYLTQSEGLPINDALALAIALSIISFGVSMGGFVVGLSERKYSTNWVKTGIVGNIILILLPIGLFISFIYPIFG